jgi:hypothetical protein
MAQSGNVALSYSFLRLIEGESDDDFNIPAGWLVSFAQPLAGSRVSIVGEAAGNYKSAFGETLGSTRSRPACASRAGPANGCHPSRGSSLA